MSCSYLPPYIVHELPDITDSINYPVRNVQRIKYTCFNVSKSLIAFGATSGGIYVFNKTPCEFVQLIPNKDGAITKLSISSDEKHIGFANGRGVVSVTKCEQSLSGGHTCVTSKEHQGNEVTAMAWSRNMLFTGDDVGKISVLQLQSFIAKTMFQSSSQIIMNLDSRICQIDVKSYMLLVSTLTRCYICDTSQEQYRQIGQKLRDGEFGACFLNKENGKDNFTPQNSEESFTEVKKFNIVSEEMGFAIGKELKNTYIYCARPSSRLWEATIDGTVQRTHQFKQVLARSPKKVITGDCYNENISIENFAVNKGKPINFSKVYSVNGAIFAFRKDSLYFLNVDNVDNTIWVDAYKDIVDCKVTNDMIYIWLTTGSLKCLRFMKIDKFLVKCYVEEKYVLCAELCALFSDYLISNELSAKLHILGGLKNKLDNKENLKNIENVIQKFDSLKQDNHKTGIYVIDNTYNAQTSLLDDDMSNSVYNEDYKFSSLPPEAMLTLKELSLTVTDKLNTSKKMIKEKWVGFEGKMKQLSLDKPIQETNESHIIVPRRVSFDEMPLNNEHIEIVDEDVIYKESSQEAIELDHNVSEKYRVCKSLYQYFRLSLVGKESETSNLISLIESYTCDISEIYNLMLLLEEHCVKIGAVEESRYVPNNIFLTYISLTERREELLELIMKDEKLYQYFVDSCISVNLKTQKLANLGCECGFPLPYAKTNLTPVFSELIDEFIEKQWSTSTRDQCYDVCKRMPHLWRKILYLRRNEDLLNILKMLLQMLDESLLHSFLPQFTIDTWNLAVQLYATLHANMCLNCSKKFSHINVRDTLSWDDLGAMMIKSVGGKNALKVMERHASLIEAGELTIRFYHTCLLVTLFEKYDVTITGPLTDAIYSSYDCEVSRAEICKLLRSTSNGMIRNTALPIVVASKSTHWGLVPKQSNSISTENFKVPKTEFMDDIIQNLYEIDNAVLDCALCGLPLQNEVLIKDGGLWCFRCGHTFHGSCLELNKIKLCPSCAVIK